MSAAETEDQHPQQPSPEQPAPDAAEPAEEADQPQDAWAARRDLYRHSPGIMLDAASSFGGSLVAADQHGVSGGRVAGDVIMGSKTEIHYRGPAGPHHASGDLPPDVVTRLTSVFAESEAFAPALEQLRSDRVVVLSGPRFTGRRTAALMLLHRLGVSPVRVLDPATSPTDLARQLDSARGYLLYDLVTHRDRPLREHHLRAVQEQLAQHQGHLVITVGPQAALDDSVRAVEWRPPPPEDVLRAQLRDLVGDGAQEAELLGLRPTVDFLARGHQLREVTAYARALARYARREKPLEELERFSLAAVEQQVQEWFDDEHTLLRDKAFLVSLASFHEAPYALTAELTDVLYALLQKTEDPVAVPRIPVFGTSIAKRLQLARARTYEEDEDTDWGPVPQLKSRFCDERAPLVLLREVWTGHPSARPALVGWLKVLADDGRTLVRTRAAATAAVLAVADLPSAMALLIEPWARALRYRFRLAAAGALTLAHLSGAPNIPGILHEWCTGPEADDRLRWTAVRGYALLGPAFPGQALAALSQTARDLAADGPDAADEELTGELTQSTEVLLLSPARGEVLAGLIRFLQDEAPVRDLALGAFLSACTRTVDDAEGGRPELLQWHARAVSAHDSEDDRHLAALWRAALGDRGHTTAALERLRDWVRQAEDDPGSEKALAALLPALAVTGPDHQRLGHLLRTLPGADGGPPPQAAARLARVLAPH